MDMDPVEVETVTNEPVRGGLNVQADSAAEEHAQRLQDEQDLRKLDEEVRMLRQVLQDKIAQARVLRIKLGQSTPLDSIENAAQNFEKNVNQFAEDVSSTEAFKKTQGVVTDVGRVTASTFGILGGAISNRFTQVKTSDSFNQFSQKATSFGSNILDQVSSIGKTTPGEFNEGSN